MELEKLGFKVIVGLVLHLARFLLSAENPFVALLLMAARVAKVWYDNRADDLTKEGMLKGIEEAAAFVLFLSPGVLQRPYCQMEIRHALALKKPMVLLHG